MQCFTDIARMTNIHNNKHVNITVSPLNYSTLVCRIFQSSCIKQNYRKFHLRPQTFRKEIAEHFHFTVFTFVVQGSKIPSIISVTFCGIHILSNILRSIKHSRFFFFSSDSIANKATHGKWMHTHHHIQFSHDINMYDCLRMEIGGKTRAKMEQRRFIASAVWLQIILNSQWNARFIQHLTNATLCHACHGMA